MPAPELASTSDTRPLLTILEALRGRPLRDRSRLVQKINREITQLHQAIQAEGPSWYEAGLNLLEIRQQRDKYRLLIALWGNVALYVLATKDVSLVVPTGLEEAIRTKLTTWGFIG